MFQGWPQSQFGMENKSQVFLIYGSWCASQSSECICDNQTGNIMAIVLQMQGLEKANCAETH